MCCAVKVREAGSIEVGGGEEFDEIADGGAVLGGLEKRDDVVENGVGVSESGRRRGGPGGVSR